ncbi:MAG: TSUP family transporter [Pseudomonadota bacterium]
MILGIPLAAFAAIAAAVFLGTILQRLSGQAYGMLVSPTVAVLAPQFLPASVLMLGIFVGAGAITFDRSAISWKEARPGMAGRVVGAFLGAAIAVALSNSDGFSIVVAVLVLVAVILSISGLRIKIRALTLILAGIIAGIMGTITAIGAPPMAILYANETAKRARTMQNLFFMWGMIWSIAALALAGLINLNHIFLVLCLLPFSIAGLVACQPAARILEGWNLRPFTLCLATLAALVILGRSFS